MNFATIYKKPCSKFSTWVLSVSQSVKINALTLLHNKQKEHTGSKEVVFVEQESELATLLRRGQRSGMLKMFLMQKFLCSFFHLP